MSNWSTAGCDSCLRFMSTIHVYDSCLRFMSTIHVYDSCLRFMSTIHVYDSCLRFMSTMQHPAAAEGESYRSRVRSWRHSVVIVQPLFSAAGRTCASGTTLSWDATNTEVTL